MEENPPLTCMGCAAVSTLDEVALAGAVCSKCGSTKFSIALEHLGDVAELAAYGPVTVSSHLCLTWAQIAVDAALRAQDATVNGNPDTEFGESLLACTAAAHAVDAFYG